ncbi:MAG: type VI secretion system baseplate subunit TssE [Hyphomicrobiales bacterium]|nr:type VI secretion system baseplate subunit TssE [Hyphomicrobiales bacterium]MBV8663151.1 type VI secretion system baseplate subunit TssE [Hyphomicrobiales bacterium]
MFDRTLTERLEGSTADRPFRPSTFDKSKLLESVLDNVRRMFNERRGSCETRPDYGMPDLNDVLGDGGTPVSLALIVQSMMETFEPRLVDPIVKFAPDPSNPLNMNFHVSATLRYGDMSERISFETVVSDDKRVRVRG